jgi:RimJ/RimL family protein N-acetyltransferase
LLGVVETIDGARVRLRRFREADTDDVVAACNDPLTSRFIPSLPNPYTRGDAVDWIERGASDVFARGGAAFAVVDPGTDRLLGATSIGPVQSGRGEIGYWVAPWARGRGVATAACTALTGVAFTAGVARLDLRTEFENGPSQRVAIAAGYLREGVQRAGGVGRDGQRHDLVQWARLAGDPAGPSRRLIPDLPDPPPSDGVVTLRPLRTVDADDTYLLRSLPDVIGTSVPPVPPTPADVARTCAHAEAHWLAGTHALLTIRDAATDRYAGEIGLHYNDLVSRQAVLGYSVLPAWRRRGYATRAVRLVAAWAFARVGVARLVAGTAPGNLASQRVLLGAGFQQEGYERSRLPGIGGTRIDSLLFALLPSSEIGAGGGVSPTRRRWR